MFVAMVMTACHRPVETVHTPSAQRRELAAIDSLMWTYPDSALTRLIPCFDDASYAAMEESDRHYAHLLLAELLYKNDYTQTNRADLGYEKTMGQALVDWWRAKDMTTGNADSLLCWNYGMTIIGDPLVNFFHCTNSTCQDQISLTSYNNSNSPLSYYLASESITVAPPSSGSFTILVGDHCILNAPTVLIDGAFLCPQGSTMEILNEGCRDNCDD